MPKIHFIDYETRSLVDLPSVGAILYAQHPSTEILMTAYATLKTDPEVRDCAGPIPHRDYVCSWGMFDFHIYRALEDHEFPLSHWIDAMALARYVSLPARLNDFGRVALGEEKVEAGKRLINKYSKPNKDGAFNELAGDDRDEMVRYALQDVALLKKGWTNVLGKVYGEWSRYCRPGWETTERMNLRGVPIDVEAVEAAIHQCEAHSKRLEDECMALCGLRPSQNVALAEFLGMESIAKGELEEALPSLEGVKKRVAEIRLESAKAATKKLYPMKAMASATGRAYGCFVFNGAHTGRGSSRDIQFQNLKKGDVDPQVFADLHAGNALENPLKQVQENIRGFISSPEKKLVVCDYAQVEARILAWLADEPALLEAFRDPTRDVYKEFASHAFKLPIEKIDNEKRAYGKIAVLGAGYGAGPGLAKQAKSYGIEMTPDEGRLLSKQFHQFAPGVRAFRQNELVGNATRPGWLLRVCPVEPVLLETRGSPDPRFRAPRESAQSLVEFVQESLHPDDFNRIRSDVLTWGLDRVAGDKDLGLWYERHGGSVVLRLPSGRRVRYHGMQSHLTGMATDDGYFVTSAFTFWDKFGNRGHIGTPVVVENLCQAIATDLKIDAMVRMEAEGLPPILEVHDEIVCEAEPRTADYVLERMLAIMEDPPAWAPKDLIRAEGKVVDRYTK